MIPSVLEPSLDLGVAQTKTPCQCAALLDTVLNHFEYCLNSIAFDKVSASTIQLLSLVKSLEIINLKYACSQQRLISTIKIFIKIVIVTTIMEGFTKGRGGFSKSPDFYKIFLCETFPYHLRYLCCSNADSKSWSCPSEKAVLI